MNKETGFSLVELLVVITIMGILLTLAIPAYRNFSEQQGVKNAARMVKDEIQFGLNKSSAGINAHWYGIAVQAKSAVIPLPYDSYTAFEITPRDGDNKVICPPNLFDLSSSPCNTNAYRKDVVKKYPSGVNLDTIALYDKEAAAIDYPSFIDVRFSQSPDSGKIIINSSSSSTGSDIRAQITRAELVFKSGTYQASLVIDGGNICDKSQLDVTACNNNLSGGSKPSRVFVVER